MRVWFLRVFVAFFLDFVMFWKSFHGCGLDMFLCSCFPNKPTFLFLNNLWIRLYPSLPISILIVSKVALFGLLPPHSLWNGLLPPHSLWNGEKIIILKHNVPTRPNKSWETCLVVLDLDDWLEFVPPPEKPRPRPQLLEIENSLRLEVLETRSPS